MSGRRLFGIIGLMLGILLAAASVSFLWIIPHAASFAPAKMESVGDPKYFNWTNDRDVITNLSWEYDIFLPTDPFDYELHIAVPYSQEFRPPDSVPGAVVDIKIMFNDRQAGRGNLHYANGANISHSFDLLQSPRQDLLHEGSNRIRAVVTINLTREPGPSGTALLTVGPVLSTLKEVDRDHDGVNDARQVVRILPSGMAAFGLGAILLPACGLAGRVIDKRIGRR